MADSTEEERNGPKKKNKEEKKIELQIKNDAINTSDYRRKSVSEGGRKVEPSLSLSLSLSLKMAVVVGSINKNKRKREPKASCSGVWERGWGALPPPKKNLSSSALLRE